MSYILDALRKSEQQRGTASVTLATPVAVQRRAPLSRMGVLLALALAVGIAIGWLRPWQAAPATPRPVVSAPPPGEVITQQTGNSVAKPIRHPLVHAGSEATPPAARPEATVPAPSIPTESAMGIMAQNELPAAIQQEIPSLSISLHGYASDPKDRIVMINDKLLRQGEFLVPGLRLEEISADGLVFSYKGYRFSHGVR